MRDPVSIERVYRLAVDLAEFFEMTPEDACTWMLEQFTGEHAPIHLEGDLRGGVRDLTRRR